jgi:hypothetical protein
VLCGKPAGLRVGEYTMSNMHHHYHNSNRPSPLEIKQLAEFDATLGDILDTDKKRRRIIYLRDAMQQINIGKTIFKGFGFFLIPFMIIPIFWPFLAFFWFMKKKANSLMDTQLANALDYWGIQKYEIDNSQLQHPA